MIRPTKNPVYSKWHDRIRVFLYVQSFESADSLFLGLGIQEDSGEPYLAVSTTLQTWLTTSHICSAIEAYSSWHY